MDFCVFTYFERVLENFSEFEIWAFFTKSEKLD